LEVFFAAELVQVSTSIADVTSSTFLWSSVTYQKMAAKDIETRRVTLEETISLVLSVYQTTWNEFYLWEQDYSRQTLHSLARMPPPSQCSTREQTGNRSSNHEYSDTVTTGTDENTEPKSFTVLDYAHGDIDSPVESTLSVESINVVPQLEPCPPYEMCTPARRNIHVGDDFEEMPFLPFADDPSFDPSSLIDLDEFKVFEWQLPGRDPDCGPIYFPHHSQLSFSHEIFWFKSMLSLHIQHTHCIPNIKFLSVPLLKPGFFHRVSS
jgi:hypothetical protein